MPDKIDQLFGDLQSRGYAKDKTLKQFREYMLAPGKQGYENRKTFFEDFKSNGETSLGSYEDFRNLLGLKAVTPQRKQQASAAIGGAGATQPLSNWANPVDMSTLGMSAWERDRQAKTTEEAPMSAHTGNGKPQKVKTQVQQQAEDIKKAMAGDEEAAKRSGLTTAAERMMDELDYLRATGKPLRNIVPNSFTAPTLVRDENGNVEVGEDGKPLIGVTTDAQRVAQYKQVERDDARKALDNALKEADKGLESRTLMALDESRKEREENPLMFALSHMGQQSTDVYQQGQERMMNQGISPEALWEAVNRDGYLESILNNDELVSRGAAAEGMDKDEYIQKVLAPQIADHYDKYLSEKFDIKGFGDYTMQRALGSVTGTILSGAVTTKKQREMRSAAIQRANEGLGSYKPGVLGRLGGEVAMFVPDATVLAMTGVFGEKAASAVGGGISWLGNKLKQEGLVTLGQVASSGSPFLAANVGRMTKWTGLTLNRAASGTGLGAFMGTSSAIQDLSVGDGSLSSVGKAFLSGFGEGTVTGALLGVTNLGAQTAAGNIAGNSLKAKLGRAGMFGTAFVAENQLFANMDRFREDDFDWVDSSADAFYMQLAGKVSSRHSLAESMKGVQRLFSGKAYTEKAKTGLSWQSDGFRLDDNERSEIERAFGGTKLEDVAVNPDNVGKILNDREAISWKTRQKVAGSMGMLEPSRPRTDRILVMDKMIDERAEDNELIETHTFNTEDEKQSILQKIREKRNNDDMLSDYGILKGMMVQEPNEVEIAGAADELLEENPNLRPEDVEKGGKSYDIVVDRARTKYDVARRVIREFAVDYNMSSEEVEEIMRKDPVERTDEEYDLMSELASRLHAEAHPKGEFHPSQSRIDGRKLAGDDGAVAPEAAENVAQEMRDADEAYYNYLNSHEKMREAVEEMGNARPDEIYMHIYNNYSGTERDEFLPILADRINAQAKQEGFVAKVGENIEDTVQQEIDRYSFKGKVDDSEDTENIITFTHNGKEYTMLNGQVGTRREPGLIGGVEVQKVDPDNSGDMIIALDENNNWVFLKPDANMQLRYESKADFSARRSEELGVQDTQTLVEAGVVRQEEKKQGGNQDNADVEASAKDTGADEAPAAASVKTEQQVQQETASEPSVSIESVTDKDGIKRYENGIGLDEAIADIQNDGFDVNEIADASIAEAQQTIDKINKKQTRTRKDLLDRKKAQDVVDYYNSIKGRVSEMGQQKESPTPVPEGEESINNVVNNNNEPKKTVTLQPKVATPPKEIDVERVKRESGTPEGRKSLLDRKKNDYGTRWKIAKLIYGDLFDEDSSVANSVEEVISMNLLRGRSLDPDSFGRELGWDMRVGRDAAKVSTMFDKRRENGGNGTTFNKVVHDIWESAENTVDGEKRFSTEEIRNALISMFNEARDKWDITEWPLKSRIEQAEKLLREENERINDEKVLGNEPITLTDEEIEKITKELPFEMATDEDIPDSPITQLEKTARELMGEEGTPNIHVIDTDRMSNDAWRKMLEDEFDVFLSDEEVGQLREERMREGVYYNEETGKITVFSGELTPDELRRRVQIIKDYIHDRDSNERRDNDEDTVVEGGEPGLHQENKGKASENRTGEGDAEPERKPEPERRDEQVEAEKKGEAKPAEQDEYLKPRNDKEKEIISDVEKKLAEEIKAAEDEVRKAKSALEKAQAKESDKATDMFSDDQAFKEKDQLFDFEDMPTDRSKEGVEKRTKSERERFLDAQEKLTKLQSEAERNSRIRGALDEERRQTKIDDKSESQPTGKPATDPMAKIEETAKEFQKEQDKQVGITREETPEQKAQAEGEEMLNEEPLTEEDINNSNLSAVQKTWAKAYLNGKTDNELYLEAYLEAKEDVRNRRQDNETDRSDAGSGTQLAGTDDNGERRPDGTGSQTGGVDAGADVSAEGGKRPESGGVSGVEDRKDDVPGTDGKRGDNGLSGQEPELDGLPPRGKQAEGGSLPGSGGHDVRRSGSDRHSGGLAEQPGTRDIKTRRTELKNKRDELLAKLKSLKEQEKKDKSGEIKMAVLPPLPSGVSSYIPKSKEQRAVFWELATTTAEYGYTYLEEGITKFNEWKDKVYKDFVEPIKDFFGWGNNEVDHYIEQVWNSDYEINGVTRTMSEWASLLEPKRLREVVGNDLKSKFEQQKAAESVEVKTGDIDNIRESLPYLLPEQQDDVLKAETQFFDESHQDRAHGNGKGIMFTNGTGTGKTYTGLGIVKRFVKQGKGRVLIITPSQEKVTDWANDGLNLGLKIEKLDDVAKATGTTATKSKGKGVVVTTYANARQNLALLEDCFDLIVYDESHKITEGKEAEEGEMFKFHQMLTNKNVERSMDRQTYWLPEWIEHRNLLKESEVNRERLEELEGIDTDEAIEERNRLNARMVEIANRFEELRPIMQEIRESKRPQAEIDSKVTKTVFLSATPFNRKENLKYAEGYIFSYPEEDKNTVGTYNHRSPEDAFLEQTFPAGYRWRYGRLESHVSNLEALGRQEVDFADYLQNQLGTMSGRMIASDYDYSRDFPVLTLDNAGRFNQAMSEVYRNRKYQPLADIMHKIWNYNDATSLFEAMKTSLVNERIKEHLARGQKVVVFHRRRTSRDIAYPFERAMDAAREAAAKEMDKNTKEKLLQAVKDFERDFQDIFEWEKTIDYTLPREQIEKRFGKKNVAFFSGAETKNAKHKSVEEFMKDNGGKDIIVIQEASGKEGISLHDQTGEHQRVEINLALPQSPIAFIQIEGRIYRIGQKSNAIFEYPLLGLDLETNLFAQQFNNALGTTENLALGSKARNLRKSIANSILENTGEVDYDRQGLGGKDMDGRVASSGDKNGFDVSIQDYYGNQKMQRGRDNREGVDYFPTPEPIGYKMVEWAQMLDGETALEPSAGHGAIARYVPETNGMTAIEPSASLFTKLQMRAGGPGRRFEEMTFEDYPLANKHDVILMNPPYGVGGKTAMEHVAKAFRHLNEGGRIIAIIPDGPAMERRLNEWLNSKSHGNDSGIDGAAVVTGEVKLPSVAFGRAGTNVMTRIVVIDKVTRAEMRKNVPQKVTVDLSNEDSVGGLFDRIRNVRMPERTIDQVAINTKKAMRTKSALEDNPFTRSFEIQGDILRIKNRSRYGMGDTSIRIDRTDVGDIIDNYRRVKKVLEDPNSLDYGKWEGKTFGSGKNAVPAIDAIKDYCEKVIKTLENVSGMTADQMDKDIRQREEARLQREREEQERKERERQERIEKGRVAIENLRNEFKDDSDLPYLESLMTKAHTGGWSSFDAQNLLKKKGVDWETGKKISTPLTTLRESYNEKMPLDLDTMERLMQIADTSIDARRKDAAKRALEMSGIHSDTGKEKENFDYSSHDEYYEKELREFLETASPISRLETKQKRKEREAAAVQQPSVVEQRKERWQVAGQPARKESYEYKLDKNTRTGEDMHLVVMNDRVDDNAYRELVRKAKALDGYYNRYKKAWHFNTEEDARKFIEGVNASNGNDGSPTTRLRSREADEDGSRFDFEKPVRLNIKAIDKDLRDIEANKWNLPEKIRDIVAEKLEKYMSDKDGDIQDIDVKPYFGEKGETTAKDALEYISNNSTDNGIKELASYLLKNIGDNGDVSVKFSENRSGSRGKYYSNDHSVSIRRSAARGVDEATAKNNLEQTIIHEIAHAITVRAIENSPEVRKVFLQIYKDYEELREQYGINTGYAAKNPKEFVAEFLGRKAFREALMELPSNEKGKTFGQKVLDFIKKHILRIKETDTFFKQADDAIKKVMDMANKGEYPYGDEVAEDGKEDLREREIKTVKADVSNVPPTKKDVIARIPEGGILYPNDDQGVNIAVSRNNAKHAMLRDEYFRRAAVTNIDKIIKNAVKIGELPVAENEKGKTESVSVYYCPVSIDGKQYSTRMVVKRFIDRKGDVLEDFSMYDLGVHKEKTDSRFANVGTPDGGLVTASEPASGYKVKDLIFDTQEKDKELIGLNKNYKTYFRSRDGENPVEADFRRKEEAGRKLAKRLNIDFEAVTELDQIHNKDVRDAIAAGHEVPGWIEIGKDGKKKIYMYLPNIRDTYEAEKTIAHETVGHYGLRELLDEKGYKDYMRSLLFDLKDESLKKYWIENVSKNGFDTYRTIDEYLAEAAEKGYGDLSMWQKVKEKFTDALRKRGFLMSPSISDVKYMVWLSKHNLEKGNIMNDIRRKALLDRLERDRYEAKVSNGEYVYGEPPKQTDAPYFPGEGKTLFRHTPSVKNQRQNYERALKRIGYVWKESHIDSMQAAVELMRAIAGVRKIEDVPGAENFILLENQMSSKEEQMDFLFNRDYMKPLDEAVAQCLPDMGGDVDSQLRNLQLYMIKKHGLERNRVLLVRDMIRELRNDPSADQNQVDTMEQDYIDTIRNLRDDLKKGIIDLREYFEETDNWIRQNLDPSYKAGDKDYSGLTELYGKKYNEADIIDEVMDIESMLGEDRVGDLWEKTKAVSQFGLDMEYEGGLDSKEKHDKVSEMFEWYVPLRGYNEKTAEEAYDYLEEHDNTRKWAGPVLMNAKGRESLSDVDVFATLGSMNGYAINRALRNQTKQAFARFVRNHYKEVDASDRLVTELPHIWAEKQYDPAGNEIWVEKFPDIPEDAKADDIANILDQYQQDMKAKQATGDAKRIRQKSNIPYRNVKAENKAQHIVDVWINGEKHAFIINGNPRAAQAINGQLKAERNSNIAYLSSISHFMAKMNTSYSPDFIKRNTERDLIYSAANIAVKENAEYWFKWAKNYAIATGRAAFGVPAMHTNLFKRYREGRLDMSNETDRYFKEFMENGGETGWVERKNLDKWKKTIKEGVQQKKITPEKVGDALLLELRPAIEAMNERAENLARFATYMTSRQSGRSIVRSVSDAKEVSVNFNRKGAGKKTVGIYKGGADNGLPDWFNNANAYMAGWSAQHFQDYIMFYNAGVQGLNNMVKNVRNNPIKGTSAFAAFAMAAMLMPRLNNFLSQEDDDKDKNVAENPYAELPEWVRRNNICIYTNNGSFATIALPIELRAMYGIGDMAAGYLTNPELRSTKNMGEDILTQLSQVMPINFLEGGEFSLWNMAPSGAVPLLEAYRNKNWLGQDIERKETEWNEDKPRWIRAFKNVGDVYVGASKRLNAATNPYKNEKIHGWADGALTDPALVEHVVNGYFGGVGSTVNRVAQLAKNAKDMSAGEILSSNWTPIARTMHYTPNERTRYSRTRNKWEHYKDEMDKTMEIIKVLKEEGKKDPISFMKSVSEEEGKKGSRAKIMKEAYKDYNKIYKKLKKTDDLQQMNIYQQRLDQIMEETVRMLDKIR